MIRIAVHLGKGGTAKSTTCWMLASFLSLRQRVLAADLDSQSSLTNALLDSSPEFTVYDVLSKTVSTRAASVSSSLAYGDNVTVLAASADLGALEQETAADFDRAYLLRDALDAGVEADVVIIDTPPSSNSILSINALTAATHLLAPVTVDALAFEQLSSLDRLIEKVRQRLNPELKFLGILPVRYDARRRLDNEVLAAIKDRYPLVHPPVAESIKVKEAMAQGLSARETKSVSLLFDEAVANIVKAVNT